MTNNIKVKLAPCAHHIVNGISPIEESWETYDVNAEAFRIMLSEIKKHEDKLSLTSRVKVHYIIPKHGKRTCVIEFPESVHYMGIGMEVRNQIKYMLQRQERRQQWLSLCDVDVHSLERLNAALRAIARQQRLDEELYSYAYFHQTEIDGNSYEKSDECIRAVLRKKRYTAFSLRTGKTQLFLCRPSDPEDISSYDVAPHIISMMTSLFRAPNMLITQTEGVWIVQFRFTKPDLPSKPEKEDLVMNQLDFIFTHLMSKDNETPDLRDWMYQQSKLISDYLRELDITDDLSNEEWYSENRSELFKKLFPTEPIVTVVISINHIESFSSGMFKYHFDIWSKIFLKFFMLDGPVLKSDRHHVYNISPKYESTAWRKRLIDELREHLDIISHLKRYQVYVSPNDHEDCDLNFEEYATDLFQNMMKSLQSFPPRQIPHGVLKLDLNGTISDDEEEENEEEKQD